MAVIEKRLGDSEALNVRFGVSGCSANAFDSFFLPISNRGEQTEFRAAGFCFLAKEVQLPKLKSMVEGGGKLSCCVINTMRQFSDCSREEIRLSTSFDASNVSGSLTFIPNLTQKLEKVAGSYYWFVDRSIFNRMITVRCGRDIKSLKLSTEVENLADDEKKQLREGIEAIIRREYPYTLEESWVNFYVDFLIDDKYLTQIVRGRSSNEIMFYFHLDFNEGAKFIPLAQGASEFKKKFGRVPQIKSICGMINPSKFNIKSWTEFLRTYLAEVDSSFLENDDDNNARRDAFAEMPLDTQLNAIYLYESFGSNYGALLKLTKKVKLDLAALNTKGIAIAMAKKPELNADLMVKGVKSLIECKEGQENFPLMRIINAFLVNAYILDNIQELIKTPKNLIAELEKIFYTCKPGAEPMRNAALKLMLSPQEFEDYQNLWLESAPNFMKAARSLPQFHVEIDSKYSCEFIDAGYPEAYLVGLETNCCQHLHSAGASCVRFMAHNPTISGIFRVMKKGQTVAQSFVWFDQKSGTVCCDNIEILGGEMRDVVWKAYSEVFPDELRKYAAIFGIFELTAGLGCNDMAKLDSLEKVRRPVHLSDVPGGENTYSDANSQVKIADFRTTVEQTLVRVRKAHLERLENSLKRITRSRKK